MRPSRGRDSFVSVHSALSESSALPWADPAHAIGLRAVRRITRRGLRQHSYLGFGHLVAACMALAGCLTAWNAYEAHFRTPLRPPVVAAAPAESNAVLMSEIPLARQARLLQEDTLRAAEIVTSRFPIGMPDSDEPRE